MTHEFYRQITCHRHTFISVECSLDFQLTISVVILRLLASSWISLHALQLKSFSCPVLDFCYDINTCKKWVLIRKM
jgi:hypothetical protein